MLIVISVPFTRNMRYLISSSLFPRLKNEHELVVVGPQFARETLRAEFGGANVRFWAFDKVPESLPRWLRYVYAISEMLRRNGYWFRFRDRGLRYYWNNITKVTVGNAAEGVQPARARGLNRIIGWLGYPRFAWRIIDAMFGRLLYDTADFKAVVGDRDDVLIIQTANWGYQERYLSYCARRYGARTMLVPYTTDQLIINGHLITAYDAICTQGPVEARYATEHHGVSADRVHPLGMVWRRNLEMIQHAPIPAAATTPKQPPYSILYAGLTSGFFPRKSELEAVDHILAAIRDGRIPPAEVVYRPVVRDDADAEALRQRFAGDPLIKLQWPQTTLVGVDQEVSGSVMDEVTEYISQLVAADVFVMSATTTMMFDALHFDIPCIANFTDPTSILCQVGFTTIYCEDDETLRAVPAMPVARSHDELVRYVRDALCGDDRAEAVRRMKAELFAEWDYPRDQFASVFFDLVEQKEQRG